eukprot:SAG31_NODE_2086_length_6484_cov_23.518716_8_plen_75_part_00
MCSPLTVSPRRRQGTRSLLDQVEGTLTTKLKSFEDDVVSAITFSILNGETHEKRMNEETLIEKVSPCSTPVSGS